MKTLIILDNLIGLQNSLIIACVCIAVGFVVFIYLFLLFKAASSAPLKPLITKPRKTVGLPELPDGTNLIILDNKEDLPIAQDIKDYNIGLKKNVLENTFYLANFGKEKLEVNQVYIVKLIGSGKIHTLCKVEIMFSPEYNTHLN